MMCPRWAPQLSWGVRRHPLSFGSVAMQAPTHSVDSTSRDSVLAHSDSAIFTAIVQGSALPVPLRVVEVRDIPASAVVPPALGLLALGLGLGFVLGHWWRGRRTR